MTYKTLVVFLLVTTGFAACTPEDAQVAVATTPPGMEGTEALLYATKGGDIATVQQFVEQDPTLLSAQDYRGNSLLHIAGGYNRLDMISYLLEAGADPTLQNYDGQTPAEYADLENADREVVEVLRNQSQ